MDVQSLLEQAKGFLGTDEVKTAKEIAEWVADFQDNKIDAPPNSVLDVSMIETAQLDAQDLIVGKALY